MAGSINKVILVGNLGGEPEAKTSSSGSKIVNLNIATTESWRDKQTGEKQERTEWHRVVIFNQNLAEVAERYLHKGSKVYIEGALQSRKWTDNAGVERKTTEIVLSNFRGEIAILDSRGGSNSSPSQVSSESSGTGANWDSYSPESSSMDPDDKIPF